MQLLKDGNVYGASYKYFSNRLLVIIMVWRFHCFQHRKLLIYSVSALQPVLLQVNATSLYNLKFQIYYEIV